MKRKSYNPLTMWGSWLGLVVSLVYFYFSTANNWFDIRDVMIKVYSGGLSHQTSGFITATWLSMAVGFLIGYGIHAAIRKFVK
jgi:hypothetical protein